MSSNNSPTHRNSQVIVLETGDMQANPEILITPLGMEKGEMLMVDHMKYQAALE